jgi:hypothetical protein
MITWDAAAQRLDAELRLGGAVTHHLDKALFLLRQHPAGERPDAAEDRRRRARDDAERNCLRERPIG